MRLIRYSRGNPINDLSKQRSLVTYDCSSKSSVPHSITYNGVEWEVGCISNLNTSIHSLVHRRDRASNSKHGIRNHIHTSTSHILQVSLLPSKVCLARLWANQLVDSYTPKSFSFVQHSYYMWETPTCRKKPTHLQILTFSRMPSMSVPEPARESLEYYTTTFPLPYVCQTGTSYTVSFSSPRKKRRENSIKSND